MPGKRKRDEDSGEENEELPDNQTHGATVFISNLPYTATSTDLKTLFSDVAPIKNAFVVLEKETKVSKGVGYVTFAMREDATQCVEKESIEMNGRNIRVSWAGAKPKPGEETTVKHPKLPKRLDPNPIPKKQDANGFRTVTLSGLPSEIDAKAIWKKVRKQTGAESVEFPAKDQDGSEDKTKAHVLFSSSSNAQRAIERLNAHIFKGSVLGAALKKRLEKRPNRSSRLIVRNLPWNITESELRKLFLPHGSVYSVEIPTEREDEEGKHSRPKAKGFAFVWMLTKPDAETAISKVNGNSIKDRTIAVDWALSKEKWLDVKEKMEEATGAEVEGEEDASEGDDESEDEGLGVHSDGDVSMQSQHSDVDDEDEPTKPELPPPEAGTTLFVRNVPWEATEDDLRQLFRSFGPLRYVRIVMDQESNRSKGTAFACYWKKEDADKVIVISEALSKETGLEAVAKNPFSAPSLLVPDPSSSLARNLVLHGRTMDVVRAVTRETADKLRDAGVKMREKADKRNMYLMREGVIFPNSPAASLLPSSEVEKRINSYNQRRTLLRSNPSLYVSKTRLSVRQLPIFASERVIKRLALHSIHEFDKEVEQNERDPLNEDEIDDSSRGVVDSMTGEEVKLPKRPNGESKTKVDRGKKTRSSGRVKQAKIVRLNDRIDPLVGKGRSKGYGFLELERHADALKVLRWANNNPNVGEMLKKWWLEELKDLQGTLEKKSDKNEEEQARLKRLKKVLSGKVEEKSSKRTLIVEFSIENVLVVKKREGRDASGMSKPSADKVERTTARSPSGAPSDRSKPLKKRGDGRSKELSESGRPAKRIKRDDDAVVASLKDRIGQRAKEVNPLGSMIGRKRRMKKTRGT